ncbi:GreA/GreB family elongation factor [Flaviaesturariibacter flavus]|nr:GreA/GreB family elongation factor [Flaviaesturariibacter flavus]
MTREDHALIHAHLRLATGRLGTRQDEKDDLEEELRKAVLVEPGEIPPDVVRINSVVVIQEEGRQPIRLTVVAPAKADASRRLISFVSPMAAALIGYRKGDIVSCRLPGGVRTFEIVDVQQDAGIHE